MAEDLITNTKKLILARYPRFGTEIAKARIEYRKDLKYHTAATDGKNVYVDPDYFASLTEEEREFLVAHEIMHMKYEHMYRMKTKEGEIRNPEIWNEATDAIINANLERDGFVIKEGYVNRPEALEYSSEEFYEILLEEKKQQQQQSKQNQNGQSGQSGEQGENSQDNNSANNGEQDQQDGQENQDGETEQTQERNGQDQNQGEDGQPQFADDHSMWQEAYEEKFGDKKSTKSKLKEAFEKMLKKEKPEEDKNQQEQEQQDFNEKEDFEKNRQERKERAKNYLDKLKNQGLQSGDKLSFDGVGESKAVVDWKLLLRREVEKTEDVWSQRRSIAENNYAYRLEENDIEDEAMTEVMIDVSGSVDLDMVKAFLRQLKPILRESKLKVGCFNEKFWGLTEIKSVRDIDNFSIPREARGDSAWTEDWDLAVRSFSKKKEVNKIVFTDGEPCPGTMPKEDLKGTNVLWLVYSNRNFKPCCGKVIFVPEKEFEQMNAKYEEPEMNI